MTLSRRERIEAMLVSEPKDLLLRYSLAMEWQKEGEHERSLAGFRELMQECPPYVPAFFRTGQQLVELGRIAEARTALRDGIEAARLQRDAHAASEMSEFLAQLGALGD